MEKARDRGCDGLLALAKKTVICAALGRQLF
jgi:hypothetical protein